MGPGGGSGPPQQGGVSNPILPGTITEGRFLRSKSGTEVGDWPQHGGAAIAERRHDIMASMPRMQSVFARRTRARSAMVAASQYDPSGNAVRYAYAGREPPA